MSPNPSPTTSEDCQSLENSSSITTLHRPPNSPETVRGVGEVGSSPEPTTRVKKRGPVRGTTSLHPDSRQKPLHLLTTRDELKEPRNATETTVPTMHRAAPARRVAALNAGDLEGPAVGKKASVKILQAEALEAAGAPVSLRDR